MMKPSKFYLVYFMNFILSNAATYLYLSFSFRAFITISILTITATHLAILVHQKKTSSLSKLMLDVALALAVTILFFLSYLGANTIALSFTHQDPDFTILRGLLMSFFITTVGVFYTIIVWLPLGVLNYILLKKILAKNA